MKHQPCPSCTDVQVDVSMERKLSKAYKHVCDYSNFMSVSVKKFKQLNMGLIRYYSEQSTSNSMNCRKILTTTGNGAIFFLVAEHNFTQACKPRTPACGKLCSLDPLAYQQQKIAPLPVVTVQYFRRANLEIDTASAKRLHQN